MLNPSSAEYKEGMAYKSASARIDEYGLWAAQQALISITDAPSLLPCPHGTTGHFKSLAVDDTARIVMLGLTTSCDVGPNKKLYSTNGSGAIKNAAGNVTVITSPTFVTIASSDGGSSRAENGTYYYMMTAYNTVYKAESLPSEVLSDEIDHDDGAKDYMAITVPAPAANTETRIYRSKRISAADGVYNATNIFYYVGKRTSAGQFADYQHDTEIANAEYEGRGSAPPSDIDYLVSFNNRMLYFKGNVLYWSSAGRPQEVAQEYTLTYDSPAASVTCKPKLSIGVYGEAKFEIAELSGHTVKAAMPLFGKLYVWTDSMMGYIEATNRLEGYRFHILREGVGVTSDKVLALSPYGLFGADRQGMWLLTPGGTTKRLTDKRVDLYAGDGTTFDASDFTNSFGVWVPRLNEYWWGVNGKIIAYQADRDIFVGPYNYAVGGGCMIVTASGAHAYLTGGKTPSLTTKDEVVQTLEFWFGQTMPKINKDQLVVEIVHSATPGADVTAKAFQNAIASITGATDSGDIAHGTSIGEVHPGGSGRFFMLRLTLPTAGAPVAAIGYEYNPINLE